MVVVEVVARNENKVRIGPFLLLLSSKYYTVVTMVSWNTDINVEKVTRCPSNVKEILIPNSL